MTDLAYWCTVGIASGIVVRGLYVAFVVVLYTAAAPLLGWRY